MTASPEEGCVGGDGDHRRQPAAPQAEPGQLGHDGRHAGTEQHGQAEHDKWRRPVSGAQRQADRRLRDESLVERPERTRRLERVRSHRQDEADEDEEHEVGARSRHLTIAADKKAPIGTA